jgi:hypothetical protein
MVVKTAVKIYGVNWIEYSHTVEENEKIRQPAVNPEITNIRDLLFR